MINNDKRRFAIDLDKVRALNPGLANAIMKYYYDVQRASAGFKNSERSFSDCC